MAEARERSEWRRTVAAVRMTGNTIDGRVPTPEQIAPPGMFDAEPEPQKSPELQQLESEMAFKILGNALRNKNRGR